jgi:hypothetical protein
VGERSGKGIRITGASRIFFALEFRSVGAVRTVEIHLLDHDKKYISSVEGP